MVIDFAGCFVIEKICKYLFANLEPKPLVTRGRERRELRRQEEEKIKAVEAAKAAVAEVEKKAQ
jgi:manganese-transporting P-type ATPase